MKLILIILAMGLLVTAAFFIAIAKKSVHKENHPYPIINEHYKSINSKQL